MVHKPIHDEAARAVIGCFNADAATSYQEAVDPERGISINTREADHGERLWRTSDGTWVMERRYLRANEVGPELFRYVPGGVARVWLAVNGYHQAYEEFFGEPVPDVVHVDDDFDDPTVSDGDVVPGALYLPGSDDTAEPAGDVG